MAPLITPRRGPRSSASSRTTPTIEALVERAWAARAGALRRLDRPVLAGQRQVRRLRRGLRLLRAVALRRGRHADARDDGARADARARARRRGGRRPPLLHGHPGPGPVQARLREGARRRAARRRADEPQALRLDRAHEPARGPRRCARRASSACTTTSRRPSPTTPRSRRPSATRAACARSTRSARPGLETCVGGILNLGESREQRVEMAFQLAVDRPDLGADQPPEPAAGHEVRRPRLHGPVGGGQVDRDLPPDPPRRAVPPLRRPRREPRRAAAPRRQGRAQRRDDGQLPHHAGLHARRGPRACSPTSASTSPARPTTAPTRGPTTARAGSTARRPTSSATCSRRRPSRRRRARRARHPSVGPLDAAALRAQDAPRRRAPTARPTRFPANGRGMSEVEGRLAELSSPRPAAPHAPDRGAAGPAGHGSTARESLLLCSNNYLGLAEHPRVREAAADAACAGAPGPAASRLVSGSMAVHADLERRLAAFEGTERRAALRLGLPGQRRRRLAPSPAAATSSAPTSSTTPRSSTAAACRARRCSSTATTTSSTSPGASRAPAGGAR